MDNRAIQVLTAAGLGAGLMYLFDPVSGRRRQSLLRDQARNSPIMEFEATMPDDTLNVDRASRLDPKTCQITTSFVAP